MCTLIMNKVTKPWLRTPLYFFTSAYRQERTNLRILKGFTADVVQARKSERMEYKTASCSEEAGNALGMRQRKAFLDLLLDTAKNGEVLTDDDIAEEVETFMFEGHDTTAANLGWTIFMLAVHSECQKRVQQELDDIFGKDYTRDVGPTDLTKMKYLESCIKESLRLYPSVPFIMRQIHSDIVLEDGRVIPAGVTTLLSIYSVHRDPNIYPNPLTFNPERFSSESVGGRSPYAFIPFSAGSRNCIGQKFALMEEKIILSKVFRMYNVVAGESLEDVIPVPDIILRSKSGFNVTLQKR